MTRNTIDHDDPNAFVTKKQSNTAVYDAELERILAKCRSSEDPDSMFEAHKDEIMKYIRLIG